MRAIAVSVAFASTALLAQAPSQTPLDALRFEVVSIKRHVSSDLFSGGSSERPDGGVTLINVFPGNLIGRAYVPPIAPIDMEGLPDWAMFEQGYDIQATSPLSRSATADERAAMIRAMLVDRFKLAAHIEKRQLPAYNLVLARSDGRLGPGIRLLDKDCESIRAAAVAAMREGKPRPTATCRPINLLRGFEGEATIPDMAIFLRSAAGRAIVDKTGLRGSYEIKVEFDMLGAGRGPDVAASPDALPPLLSALPDQLGLRLESSTSEGNVLVVERLERPTEN